MAYNTDNISNPIALQKPPTPTRETPLLCGNRQSLEGNKQQSDDDDAPRVLEIVPINTWTTAVNLLIIGSLPITSAPSAAALGISLASYMYMLIMIFFFGSLLSGGRVFFSHFLPQGKLACHGFIMTHVWILAELRGGVRRIKRRLAGSVWQGIAFRLPETSRSLGTPQIVFQILVF